MKKFKMSSFAKKFNNIKQAAERIVNIRLAYKDNSSTANSCVKIHHEVSSNEMCN